MTSIAARTVERRSGAITVVHIFVRSKLPWVVLPEDVPAFDVYYDLQTQWPAESLERRRAILGG